MCVRERERQRVVFVCLWCACACAFVCDLCTQANVDCCKAHVGWLLSMDLIDGDVFMLNA